jgi:aminopeptidase
MKEQMLRNYAKVVLTVGVNLQKGQNLVVRAEPVHWNFLNILAEEAYKMGARYVRMEADSAGLQKARVDHSQEEYLDYVPQFVTKTLDTYLDEGWARLAIDGKENPGLLKSVDKKRLGKVSRAHSLATKPFMEQVMMGKLAWCVIGVPTPGWAAEVFGCEPSAEAEQKLWEILIPILRLDKADPVKEWQNHAERLMRRAAWLNNKNFKEVHFQGPGTDLHVSLAKRSQWEAANAKTTSGIEFMANVPTEEIFTTPDWRGVEGTVRCTKPVTIMGTQVNDMNFVFKNGSVVDFDAKVGKEALAQYLSMDEGATRLGEVALVGVDSPIHRVGQVFSSILFDENASCHIALGSGYINTWKDGDKLSEEQKVAEGFNDSIVHTDFMIGSERVSVDGITQSGERVAIIKNGEFVI